MEEEQKKLGLHEQICRAAGASVQEDAERTKKKQTEKIKELAQLKIDVDNEVERIHKETSAEKTCGNADEQEAGEIVFPKKTGSVTRVIQGGGFAEEARRQRMNKKARADPIRRGATAKVFKEKPAVTEEDREEERIDYLCRKAESVCQNLKKQMRKK